jgi:hypothetical protein
MGDSRGIAIAEMRERINSGVRSTHLSIGINGSQFRDTRAEILDETSFFNDGSLVEAVYDAWQKNADHERSELSSVDYAYYLEQHGRTLPTEYWIRRLDEPKAFENAVKVFEKRAPAEASARLERDLEQLNARSGSSRLIELQSALYRLTGKSEYENALVTFVQSKLGSGRIDPDLHAGLMALGASCAPASLEVLASAMNSKNLVLRDAAIDALGKHRTAEARNMLVKSAEDRAREGEGFPFHELNALIEQGEPAADQQYERLKAELLGGILSWHASIADFAQLDFRRAHRHP